MRRRIVCLGLAAGMGLCLAFWLWPRSRPNLLLVTLDTTRADRLGCYGYELAETPHLDALANRGILFERAYAPAPMTAPSHASMMTGLWPPEHGVYTNGRIALESGIPTAAALLHQRGYTTAAFVAAFVLQAKFGLEQGFLVYDDDLSTAETRGDILHRYRDGRHVVDSAIQWLKKQRHQSSAAPFFCWVHLYDPHDPYVAHEREFGDKFRDRPYDGELAYIDRQVGRLLGVLNELGCNDRTVIVVVGDHGESLGEHGEETHGYMLHESTLRVPLIMADPRSAARGRRVADPVSLVGIFPTILELAGVTPPEPLKDRSLKPALDGNALPSQVCFSQTEEPYLQACWSPLQALTTDRWRYVRTSKPELYDLLDDPRELHNLADQRPERVAELEAELAALEARFRQRTSSRVSLSEREQRALESLGYAGGGSSRSPERPERGELPDIKDMIGRLNELHHATALLNDGMYEEAAALLEPLAREAPRLLRAKLNLGLCRIQLGQFDEAARWLESALEIDPHSDRAHDMLGFACLKLGQLDQAAEHFQRLLELNPDSVNGHLFLGEVYQRRQQFPLAIREYEEVLRLDSGNNVARQALEALSQSVPRP
jgi:arylsulfatase A-like enzyme/Flp pilus assembly protein TadD